MRSKRVLLAVVFVLAATLYAAAEVALDEVVQAGRFVLYRDHADAHKYYYVPDAPRLAVKRDGTPEFTFIKYTKTDGATKGGIVHFLVTWGMTEGELSSAESALRLKDPEAKIAGPVPFKEGTFKVVSATAGEGGIFSRKIVGEGKAPIMPGQKAAVSIALTEEGASLLWESFKNPTSDISVMFALKFTGVTPAFQAKLKVNWDKVYTQHDIKLHAEGTIQVVKLQADVRAILEELRQKGAIQLEVVGENQDMQKMLDVVYAHLLSLMCEKVPMGAGEATSPAVKRPAPAPIADRPEVHPAWSTGVLAEVVRAADERLRGGPFIGQEQAQAQRAAPSSCDEQAKQSAENFERRAIALIDEDKYTEAIDMLEKAYAACPIPLYKYTIAKYYADVFYDSPRARAYFEAFLEGSRSLPGLDEERGRAQTYIADTAAAPERFRVAQNHFDAGSYYAAVEELTWLWDHVGKLEYLWNLGLSYLNIGEPNRDRYNLLNALRCFQGTLDAASVMEGRGDYMIEDSKKGIDRVLSLLGSGAPNPLEAGGVPATRQAPQRRGPRGAAAQEQAPQTQAAAQQTQVSTEQEARRQRRQEAQQAAQQTQAGQPQAAGAAQQTTSAGAQTTGGTKPPDTTGGGTKPPTAGQAGQQTMSSGQRLKPPDTTGGTKPPSGQTPAAKTQPGTSGKTPEVKPIVSVQIGYSFKRVKMSGNYEVDMRKRLREDRDIVMSGNIGGIYQKYGEDKRFFTVVSLDDPTFQERSVEVILDGQDASDFKNFINSVSVLFRKQRFSGAPMTGEVKFVDQQFAQSGNRLSFKYGRLNEASTEWLDYEYKPKWSFYGGVEWEGDWTKTSDSVLTLAPPVRRRTLEISIDEDNILKNNVKALAVQIKHQIYGKDILKEVVINYDKGDPLQADYTYMHEDGNLGYSYKVVWLFLDGREIHTDWMAKESPFIYAVYTK